VRVLRAVIIHEQEPKEFLSQVIQACIVGDMAGRHAAGGSQGIRIHGETRHRRRRRLHKHAREEVSHTDWVVHKADSPIELFGVLPGLDPPVPDRHAE